MFSAALASALSTPKSSSAAALDWIRVRATHSLIFQVDSETNKDLLILLELNSGISKSLLTINQ